MSNSTGLKLETATQKSSSNQIVENVVQPSPKLVSSQNFGRCEEFRGLVEQYSWDANTMLAIMQAESNCNPNADNTGLNQDGTNDKGLLQINSIHGYADMERLNPVQNIKIGFKIWQSQGYRAWSSYNNGSYKRFIR